MVIKYKIMLALKCIKIGRVYVVYLMCIFDLHAVRLIKFFYHIFLYHINCILVTRHHDRGHRGDQNMLVKNNYIWLIIFKKVHLLVCQVNIKNILWNTWISCTSLPVKTTKAWGGVGVQLHSFLTSVIDVSELSTTSRSGRFTSAQERR
jgi:hypothetical protein